MRNPFCLFLLSEQHWHLEQGISNTSLLALRTVLSLKRLFTRDPHTSSYNKALMVFCVGLLRLQQLLQSARSVTPAQRPNRPTVLDIFKLWLAVPGSRKQALCVPVPQSLSARIAENEASAPRFLQHGGSFVRFVDFRTFWKHPPKNFTRAKWSFVQIGIVITSLSFLHLPYSPPPYLNYSYPPLLILFLPSALPTILLSPQRCLQIMFPQQPLLYFVPLRDD